MFDLLVKVIGIIVFGTMIAAGMAIFFTIGYGFGFFVEYIFFSGQPTFGAFRIPHLTGMLLALLLFPIMRGDL